MKAAAISRGFKQPSDLGRVSDTSHQPWNKTSQYKVRYYPTSYLVIRIPYRYLPYALVGMLTILETLFVEIRSLSMILAGTVIALVRHLSNPLA